jgi:hypothetical protein
MFHDDYTFLLHLSLSRRLRFSSSPHSTPLPSTFPPGGRPPTGDSFHMAIWRGVLGQLPWLELRQSVGSLPDLQSYHELLTRLSSHLLPWSTRFGRWEDRAEWIFAHANLTCSFTFLIFQDSKLQIFIFFPSDRLFNLLNIDFPLPFTSTTCLIMGIGATMHRLSALLTSVTRRRFLTTPLSLLDPFDLRQVVDFCQRSLHTSLSSLILSSNSGSRLENVWCLKREVLTPGLPLM